MVLIQYIGFLSAFPFFIMQKIKRDDALAIVRSTKEQLHAEGVPLHQVFLFGSFAKDKQHEWSDIDMAVVHDPFLETAGKEKSLLFEKGKSCNVRLEIISFRPDAFMNRYSSLAKEVQESGVPVD